MSCKPICLGGPRPVCRRSPRLDRLESVATSLGLCWLCSKFHSAIFLSLISHEIKLSLRMFFLACPDDDGGGNIIGGQPVTQSCHPASRSALCTQCVPIPTLGTPQILIRQRGSTRITDAAAAAAAPNGDRCLAGAVWTEHPGVANGRTLPQLMSLLLYYCTALVAYRKGRGQ